MLSQMKADDELDVESVVGNEKSEGIQVKRSQQKAISRLIQLLL